MKNKKKVKNFKKESCSSFYWGENYIQHIIYTQLPSVEVWIIFLYYMVHKIRDDEWVEPKKKKFYIQQIWETSQGVNTKPLFFYPSICIILFTHTHTHLYITTNSYNINYIFRCLKVFFSYAVVRMLVAFGVVDIVSIVSLLKKNI